MLNVKSQTEQKFHVIMLSTYEQHTLQGRMQLCSKSLLTYLKLRSPNFIPNKIPCAIKVGHNKC